MRQLLKVSDMKNQIQDLANSMGVSAHDVLAMAQSMANSIKHDKAAEAFTSGNAETQRELTEAYAIHAAKKFDKFHSAYLTNPTLRKNFCGAVYDLAVMV